MEQLTFINSRGQSVVLGDSAPYILTRLEGMGAPSADIQTQKAPFQDGDTFIDAMLEPRTPYAEIMILANNAKEMYQRRRELIKAFNPKLGKGTLIYESGDNKKLIEAVAEQAPIFPDGGDFKETMQRAIIQLYCSDPHFADEFEETQEMAAWLGGLEFPFALEPLMQFEEAGDVIIISNDGDVDTPIIAEFNGPAVNPRIENQTTGEYIRIKRELADGEKLIINTAFGNKSVTIGGQNVMHYLDLESTFWQLLVGDNVISYTADSGKQEATVLIKWKNRYVGV